MNINIFKWQFSPFLILLALWLPIDNAQAAKLLGVTCKAGLNATPGSTGIVTLSDITPANANNESVTVQLNWSCTQTGLSSGFVSLCFGVDGGSYNPSTISPRYMSKGTISPTLPRLAFNMIPQGTSLWGKIDSGNEYITAKIPIDGRPAGSSIDTVITGFININIAMSGATNALATDGTYTNNFLNTALEYDADTNSGFANCSTSPFPGKAQFPFTVQAKVIKDCKINTTSDINLNTHPATDVNITGNTVIGVTCTNTIPYSISLTPSNNATDGAGIMSGSIGNPDKVPYNLSKVLGTSSSWGNISSNWVAGTGDATNQNRTVYVNVPSADFKPDNYSDTVTISVKY